MNTNFFNHIHQLDFTGVLQLNISKGAENNLIVSLLLNNDECGDPARKLIPPLNLRGTAEELNEAFFKQITTPVQTVSGLMVDMEKFLKQLEEVKQQSAIEKNKGEKEKREKETKDKRYKEAISKADELEKEGRFREAWMKVPSVTDFPEMAEEIRKRKTALADKFSAPSLFAAIEEVKQPSVTKEDVTAAFPATDTTEEREELT